MFDPTVKKPEPCQLSYVDAQTVFLAGNEEVNKRRCEPPAASTLAAGKVEYSAGTEIDTTKGKPGLEGNRKAAGQEGERGFGSASIDQLHTPTMITCTKSTSYMVDGVRPLSHRELQGQMRQLRFYQQAGIAHVLEIVATHIEGSSTRTCDFFNMVSFGRVECHNRYY